MEATNSQHKVRLSPEETATRSMEDVLLCPQQPQPQTPQQQQQETRPRPQPEKALKCPRCSSRDTKFCYYNNYSYNQPRYFCKGCKRYWTKGGTLRNVPVGGNSRKKKRSSSPSSSSSSKKTRELATPPPPPSPYRPATLDLSFARLQNPHPEAFLLRNPSHAAISGAAVMPPPPPRFLDILRTTELLSGATTSTLCDLQPYGFSGLLNAEEMRAGGGDVCVCGRHVMLPPFEELGGPAPAVGPEASPGSLEVDNSRMFMGLQRQAGGNGSTSADQGREYLSAGGSSWQGLVNSSLI
ncbi:hypothetical protein Taro_023018 [Colocasia esculenta]|uniref:Dof zinc finger protein n=1 Tax=Colocasia esculenta TaxID=4460 RepID=A0A843VA36_COLES|nr:hypothetical protein [Colocasia esculenta]